ncbi:MAG: ATP-dependent Clp protease ATP-binding subunit [Firmicutes bacterium]|nr:ATP-dependent Clp protease ATP-binding subunit [Bacillota bacterium]
MFNNFGVHIASIFRKAEEERYELRHPYVGTEHLLLAILSNDKDMILYLREYGLTYDKFRKELNIVVGNASKNSDINLYTPLLKRVINNALENAKENNNGIVTTKHLILSILEEGEGIAIRLLVSMNIDIDSIYDDLNKNNKLTNKKLELYETGIPLNDTIDFDECVVGRDKEIDLIIETLLRKKKNNPILIGDAGVGKTAIVEELVRRIERKEVPDILFNTKIVALEMGSLVSGTKYRGEFEEKLTKIIKELEQNSNVILFIDEIHSMVNAGGAEGAITAGDIFKPALARGKIKCIGATTTNEYQKFFSGDKALMRRFEIINVEEPNQSETKDILLKVKNEYENHHKVIIPDNIIEKVIYYSDKFITTKKNPDKAIDFLDSICSKVKTNNNYNLEKKNLYQKLESLKKAKKVCVKNNDYDKALEIYSEEIDINKKIKNFNDSRKQTIKENDIINVLENKTNMIFTKTKLNFLDNIKKSIQKDLYGVDKYVDNIITLIQENLLNKIGFLKVYLEGEAYLGKSTIVKIIAENFPRCNFIKIDLKEYRSSCDINKLIGTTQGYIGYNDAHIFSKLKNDNFSIILFDNYNCAHPNIKELIKSILKEKIITDNKGDKIYFNNTFIFITDDIEKNNKVGFNNKITENKYNELYDLVDSVIKLNNLNKETLINYLESKNVINKDKILKESEYEKYNYKNVGKLIKEHMLINN